MLPRVNCVCLTSDYSDDSLDGEGLAKAEQMSRARRSPSVGSEDRDSTKAAISSIICRFVPAA